MATAAVTTATTGGSASTLNRIYVYPGATDSHSKEPDSEEEEHRPPRGQRSSTSSDVTPPPSALAPETTPRIVVSRCHLRTIPLDHLSPSHHLSFLTMVIRSAEFLSAFQRLWDGEDF
ncbi:hypothetical protein BDZ89DRAFT_1152582 [Hymenopellis radicata]|nr:hypothetical protein BDZ89DRAFT_1152582 [Hymenopellis radicata]